MGPNETRLFERLKGVRNMHADWGPKAATMTREERAGVLLKILDEMDAGTLEVRDLADEGDDEEVSAIVAKHLST